MKTTDENGCNGYSEEQAVNLEVYEKPAIEVIEMEAEGILCGSGSGDDYTPGGGKPWS